MKRKSLDTKIFKDNRQMDEMPQGAEKYPNYSYINLKNSPVEMILRWKKNVEYKS